MWDRVEKIFPELLPVVRRQTVVVRVLLLVAVVGVPVAASLAWNPVVAALREGGTIEIPVRGLALVVAALVLSLAITFMSVRHFRQRSRLRAFVRQWVDFRQHFEHLYMKIEVWLHRDDAGFEDRAWSELTPLIREHFSRQAPLRRLLFLVGEQALVARENQHWRELKAKQAVFKERDYLTPFSFLLDIGAPIGSVNHYGEAIWDAFFISDEYLEYLQYKHSFLGRVMKSAA